jgi:hypothetical protein
LRILPCDRRTVGRHDHHSIRSRFRALAPVSQPSVAGTRAVALRHQLRVLRRQRARRHRPPRRTRIGVAVQAESGPSQARSSGAHTRRRVPPEASRLASIVRCHAAPSNACGVTQNSFCNFHIAIGDEKTSAANLITRAADSCIGGSILLLANKLKSLVGAQGLEPWTR